MNKENISLVDGVQLSLDVTNIGDYAGKEIVQVYVREVNARLVHPEKELKAFTKILLKPGETKQIKFSLDRESFWFYDPKKNGWTVDSGDYEILIGASSRDIRLSKQVTIDVQ